MHDTIDLSKSISAAAVGAGDEVIINDEMMDSLKRLSPCNKGKLLSMLSHHSSEAFKDFLSGSEIPRNKKEELLWDEKVESFLGWGSPGQNESVKQLVSTTISDVLSQQSPSAAAVDESPKKKSIFERLNLFGRKKSSEPKSPSASPEHDLGRSPLPPQRTTAAYGQTQLQEFESLKPGSRGSYGSIGSKSSGRGSALSSYLQEEAVDNTAGSSGEGEFSRGSLHNTSFMSNSSTSSSISSNTSKETVVEGNTRDHTSRIDLSRYNREDGPSVLYNEPESLVKKFGLEPAFEYGKYGQPPASSSHAEREKKRRKQIPMCLGFSTFYGNDRLYY